MMRGLDGENIGIETYAEWFKRNIRIYSNVLDLTEEEDIIMIIFGTSHIRLLHLFFQDNPDYTLVPILEYLK